jgi:hypothetical protein
MDGWRRTAEDSDSSMCSSRVEGYIHWTMGHVQGLDGGVATPGDGRTGREHMGTMCVMRTYDKSLQVLNLQSLSLCLCNQSRGITSATQMTMKPFRSRPSKQMIAPQRSIRLPNRYAARTTGSNVHVSIDLA